jgi:ribosomal 50S subunit-associated protein YjgA (DUF615 family)
MQLTYYHKTFPVKNNARLKKIEEESQREKETNKP